MSRTPAWPAGNLCRVARGLRAVQVVDLDLLPTAGMQSHYEDARRALTRTHEMIGVSFDPDPDPESRRMQRLFRKTI